MLGNALTLELVKTVKNGKWEKLSELNHKKSEIDIDYIDPETGRNLLGVLASALEDNPSYQDIFTDLIKRKVDINHQDHEGMTPLMLTVLHEQVGLMQVLLKALPDLFMKNKSGETVFSLASDCGSTYYLSKLIQHAKAGGFRLDLGYLHRRAKAHRGTQRFLQEYVEIQDNCEYWYRQSQIALQDAALWYSLMNQEYLGAVVLVLSIYPIVLYIKAFQEASGWASGIPVLDQDLGPVETPKPRKANSLETLLLGVVYILGVEMVVPWRMLAWFGWMSSRRLAPDAIEVPAAKLYDCAYPMIGNTETKPKSVEAVEGEDLSPVTI